jgi:hypothetical protein
MVSLFGVYPIGMQCTVNKPCMNNAPGSLAVVYEQYQIGKHQGVSLIFPNGEYCGFSIEDLTIWEVNPVMVIPGLSNYQFEYVGNLQKDYLKGAFANAFKPNKVTKG